MGFKITFANQKTEIEVEGGTLAETCKLAGYPLNLVCGQMGTCGKCAVTVKREGKTERVLACRTAVDRDMTVFLEPSDYEHRAKVLTESNQEVIRVNPSIKKEYYTRESLKPEQGGAFLRNASVPVMQKFAAMNARADFSGCTFVYFLDELIDIQEGDTRDACYGAAIDIGTTTVAVYLYDLAHNKRIATKSGLNKQIIHGADVIARNLYAQEKESNLLELQRLIRDTINELLKDGSAFDKRVMENLYHIVLCGNSTMQHLFFGLNPAKLGASPFANITENEIICRGKEMGLSCAKEGVVEFLPLLGGFVGADTLSVLLTLPEDSRNYLMVDLGTNGEIAVGNQDGFLVTSTACGPALEGGNIACGMRGTKGAIEKVSLKNDTVTLNVIGDGNPVGLCGSGIIDAVAELRSLGMIDENGVLLSSEEYKKQYPESILAEHLKEVEEHNMAFYFGEDQTSVYLSQKDIRQVQLAKSSIYSGCMTLLEEAGIQPEQVDGLFLAGAFGNYIDIDHALSIGLLPPVPRERIFSVGNGAGQGVQSILMDHSFREKLLRISVHCTHVELADHPGFMDEYIKNMNFNFGRELAC